jgi:hypothetical protein
MWRLFTWFIIRLFQFIFLVRTVFLSHNKSANSVFQPVYEPSRTGPWPVCGTHACAHCTRQLPARRTRSWLARETRHEAALQGVHARARPLCFVCLAWCTALLQSILVSLSTRPAHFSSLFFFPIRSPLLSIV